MKDEKVTKTINPLKKIDSVLEQIIHTIPPLEMESTHNVFHDLMSCILEQQIHYRSTKKIFQKMLSKSNLEMLTPNNFPVFEEKAFDGIKLSMKKYETVSNILQHWEKNSVKWETLSDDEVKKELAQIKGVGAWTIDMILIYTLQRPDVISYDDFHIKQIMTNLYNLDPKSKLKAQMKEIGEQWSPYKSTAFRYLLDWKKYNKGIRKDK